MEIWAEKYRPTALVGMFLPGELLNQLVNYEASGIPNLLLAGNPGVGKTTIAKIISSNYDSLYLNGSDSGRLLDTFRTEVKTFCTTVSLEDKQKLVFIDEADNLTTDTQLALRSFIESVPNVRFILTANYPYKLSEALLSRFNLIRIELPEKTTTDAKELMRGIYEDIRSIFKTEGIPDVNEARLKMTIFEHYPDIRSIYIACQQLADTKNRNKEPEKYNDSNIEDLVKLIKAKEFNKMRGWIESYQYTPDFFFTKLHDVLYNELSGEKLANAVIITNDSAYKSKFVFNQYINMAACCFQLMLECF